MKTIHQLAKVARRVPRIRRKAMQILMKGRRGGETLTDTQVNFFRTMLVGAQVAAKFLGDEIKRRNIGGKPFRDARPLKVQKAATAMSLAQNPPMLAAA